MLIKDAKMPQSALKTAKATVESLTGKVKENEERRKTLNDVPTAFIPVHNASVDALATVAMLNCLQPPAVAQARVLEIGCHSGANLLAQAMYIPDASFVGIDSDQEAIRQGRTAIDAIGLDNIALFDLDICEADDQLGTFDYIICNNVYSYVDDTTRQAILDFCNHHLSDTGVAMVSFNALPGYRNMEGLRDLMQYANAYNPQDSYSTRLGRAKAVAEMVLRRKEKDPVLSQTQAGEIAAWKQFLQADDAVLNITYINEHNDAFTFYHFINEVQKHDLIYVSDMNMNKSIFAIYPQEFQDDLQEMSQGNHLIKEQLYDYIVGTDYRMALLARKSQERFVTYSEGVSTSALDSLRYRMIVNKRDEYAGEPVFQALLDRIASDCADGLGTAYTSYSLADLKAIMAEVVRSMGGSEQQVSAYQRGLHSFIVRRLVFGDWVALMYEPKQVAFEEGKTIVPERFTQYVSTILTGDGVSFMSLGTQFGEHVTSFTSVDPLIMDLLKEPQEEARIIATLDQLGLQATDAQGQTYTMSGADYWPTLKARLTAFAMFQSVE